MYNWLWITIASGFLFGFYDIFTKKALEKVPLLNVLALYTFFNFVLVSFDFKNALNADYISIIIILVKSIVIFFSWMLSFTAFRRLPISIISPFSTLTPVFTIMLSLFVLNEKLLYMQYIGIAVTLFSYFLIGRVGSIEVKGLFKNKYLYLMVASTFLSSISSIIDKFLLKTINTGQMQFWFNLFVFLLYASAFVFGRIRDNNKQPVKFSYFIILMSIFLVVSDRIYFTAVKIPASEISIIMPLRRISVFVSAILGGFIFKEKNLVKKFVCACLLILGIALVFAAK